MSKKRIAILDGFAGEGAFMKPLSKNVNAWIEGSFGIWDNRGKLTIYHIKSGRRLRYPDGDDPRDFLAHFSADKALVAEMDKLQFGEMPSKALQDRTFARANRYA